MTAYPQGSCGAVTSAPAENKCVFLSNTQMRVTRARETPRREIIVHIFRVRGRHRGPIRALSGTHSPRGCVRCMWNDQTGGTNRFLIRRALARQKPRPGPRAARGSPRRIIRVWGRHRRPVYALSGTHSPRGCVRCMWNDQTGGTNRFLMRRALARQKPRPGPRAARGSPRRIIRVWGRHRRPVYALSGTHSPRGCVRWLWNDQTGGTNRFHTCRAD